MIIKTEWERSQIIKALGVRKLPFTVEVKAGKPRSLAQNSLQRLWLTDISEQLGGHTPEELRGYCKLHFGIPILRAADDKFCALYDEKVRPYSYEEKLRFMMVPFDFPVTRLMNTKQKTQYLDQIHRKFTEMGCILTSP